MKKNSSTSEEKSKDLQNGVEAGSAKGIEGQKPEEAPMIHKKNLQEDAKQKSEKATEKIGDIVSCLSAKIKGGAEGVRSGFNKTMNKYSDKSAEGNKAEAEKKLEAEKQ